MKVLIVDPHSKRPYNFVLMQQENSGWSMKAHGEADLKELHRRLNRSIDLLVIETQYMNKNAKVAMDLATNKGKVLGWCETHDIPYVEVFPASWKSYHGIIRRGDDDKKRKVKEYDKALRRKLKNELELGVLDEQDCYLMFEWWRNTHER